MKPATPGQAAYEAAGAGFRDKYGPSCEWDRLDADIQAAWEVAAQAAIDARPQRVPELGAVAYEAAETGALRDEIAHRSDRLENLAAEWEKRAAVAYRRAEHVSDGLAHAYADAAEMLEHCAQGLRRAAGLKGTP